MPPENQTQTKPIDAESWAILKRFLPYLWPRDNPGLRRRIVIALMLGSFIEAAFVMAVVPYALIGVLLIFFLHGKDLSLFAMIGTIGLSGVVVNASIVMVDAIHRELSSMADASLAARRQALAAWRSSSRYA